MSRVIEVIKRAGGAASAAASAQIAVDAAAVATAAMNATLTGNLADLGITASAAELNLLDGIASLESVATDVTTALPNSRAVVRGRGWTYFPPIDASSGTAFDFNSIPSWATEIVIQFELVSLSGNDYVLVQIGDSGGIEATGYVSSGTRLSDASAVSVDDSTAGFMIYAGNTAVFLTGTMHLTRNSISSLQWFSSHAMRRASATCALGGGVKTLSAALDRVRITRNGSNTFDGPSSFVTVGFR